MPNVKKLFENGPVCFLPANSKEDAENQIKNLHSYASHLKERIQCTTGIFVDSKSMKTEVVIRVELVSSGEAFRKPRKTTKAQQFIDAKIKNIMKMRENGLSFETIGEKYGTTKQNIQQFLKYHERKKENDE